MSEHYCLKPVTLLERSLGLTQEGVYKADKKNQGRRDSYHGINGKLFSFGSCLKKKNP